MHGLREKAGLDLRRRFQGPTKRYVLLQLALVAALLGPGLPPGERCFPGVNWLAGIGSSPVFAQDPSQHGAPSPDSSIGGTAETGDVSSQSAYGGDSRRAGWVARTGVDALVAAPGSSNSIAAGVWNPAAWPIQQRGGLHLAWNRFDLVSDLSDFRGVLSLGNLGVSMRRRSWSGREVYDYTTGFGWGNRSNASGVSYSWTRGASGTFGSSERITVGSIHRWRPLSLGLVRTWERADGDNFYQGDIGIRPLGSRLTFFADAQKFDNADWGDVVFALGTEVQVHEGLAAALRWQDNDQVSLRLEIALPGVRPSYRHHLDDDGYRASTYAVEVRSGPDLSYILGRGASYPKIDLKGPLTYRTYRYFDGRRRLVDLLAQIDAYATDPRVGGVVLKTSGLRMSAASMWEVRAQLEGLRAEGKTVILYLDRMSVFAYSFATVADEIWIDPAGSLDLRGLTFGRTYYRRLLDKMGVGIEEWRYFTYKSAVETLVRTSMSDADREQTEALLDDFYEEIVAQILNSRGIDRGRWNEIVDERGVVYAEEALELGLIDRIGSFEEAQKAAPESEVRGPTGDRLPGTDIASTQSVAGLGTVFGDRIWRSEEWGEPSRIGLLYAIGICAMDSGIQGRRLSKSIRAMRKDPQIKAIVLRVDSPGGDALPSDLVAREIREAASVKPVIVSQGQVAASGGYWVSMYGDRILASPFTVTGSIGVISMNIWDAGISDKVGMDYDSVQRGRSADIGSGPALPGIGVQIPRRPLTDPEKARAEKLIRDLYDGFVHQVATGRGMEDEEIAAVAEGRIWSGRAGVAVDLVDEIGGLWRAIEIAKEEAGIAPDRSVQLVQGPSLGAFDRSQFFPKFPGLSLFSRDPAGADRSASGAGNVPVDWLSGWQPEESSFRGAESGRGSNATGFLRAEAPWKEWGQVHGLGLAESLYLSTMLTRLDRPMLMMAPFSLEGVTEVP